MNRMKEGIELMCGRDRICIQAAFVLLTDVGLVLLYLLVRCELGCALGRWGGQRPNPLCHPRRKHKLQKGPDR